uniref:Uncharacterized protein n=1 Tax=Anguilla anguilla TaxID=7936 RepID=A0A0E9W8H6_ANGAN
MLILSHIISSDEAGLPSNHFWHIFDCHFCVTYKLSLTLLEMLL